MEPGDVERKAPKPRAIDAEKSLRQRMGIDGDAIAEERQAAQDTPFEKPDAGLDPAARKGAKPKDDAYQPT